MVFESVVVDVLNRFIGDYVENLNRNQLKLGIWGGDVVLENLILKRNALEELNLPIQTVYGHLGKLTLKIPWKNLYGASVEATIERLYLIVNPVSDVQWDEAREEALALAAKQAELKRIEEAKKKEDEEDKLDETFVEKLVTQIIKNVQLKITDIHVRYEDSTTNARAPFALGLTLHNLSVHTTDENWRQAVIQESVTKIYKILSLDGLAIYWNSACETYSKMEPARIKAALESQIPTKDTTTNCDYILGPINATSMLRLNPKPEADSPRFSVPKVALSLHMEELSVQLNKLQYQDMTLLADSLHRMSIGAPYRKYRPKHTTYHGHYRDWWHFAYESVLNEDVLRRRSNWQWSHIRAHRTLCKDYACAYQTKLYNKGKVTPEQKTVLDKGEKFLDVLNLVVIRQRIELEVARLGRQEETKKARGWFGWWYGAAKEDDAADDTDVLTQLEKAMTPEEKAKLYRALDYHENSAPQHLPAEYVATECRFQLDRLRVTVTSGGRQVVDARVEKVAVDMDQRPSANAVRFDVTMREFRVAGAWQGSHEPQLVTSHDVSPDVNLLNITFATNPLDRHCDQHISVSARPLEIVYDAQTVIDLVDTFKAPTESSALASLQVAAGNKLSDLKEKSALGMQYAVQKHIYVDIDIDIAASHILIPKTGLYLGHEPCVVVKLGAIRVQSAPRSEVALDIARMYREGVADADILAEIVQHSYDRMKVDITEMQIIVALSEEDWRGAIASPAGTDMHLLQPTSLAVDIHKCLIVDDPRLPKVKVTGEWQRIVFCIAEDRLLNLCEIFVSMPLPQSNEITPLKIAAASSVSLFKYLDPTEKQKRERSKKSSDEPSVQLTELDALFIMNEFKITVRRQPTSDEPSLDKKLLEFTLNMLEIAATQKTYTLTTVLRLGSVSMLHHRPQCPVLDVIQTPLPTKETTEKEDAQAPAPCLFKILYRKVDKRCPSFRSRYGSVEQAVEVDFSTLKLLLNLEGIQGLLVIANQYQLRLNEIQAGRDRTAHAGPLPTIVEDEDNVLEVNRLKPAHKQPSSKHIESIQFKTRFTVGAVKVGFETDARPLSELQLLGMNVALVMKASYTQLDCTVANVKVKDLNPMTVHKEILKVLGGDVINVQVVMYNVQEYPHISDVNLSIDAQINCIRIVYLNWFISSMLDFLNNFQEANAAIKDAAETARANVKNAQQESNKMALRVRFAAPIVVVPENSRSKRAMFVDFGRMTLSNKLLEHAVPNVDQSVVIDDLTIDLEAVKISCVELTDDHREIYMERQLLQPTTFQLLIRRNLSTWCVEVPDLDLSGRIKAINISIGQNDYRSIMNILSQNLQEGQKHTEEARRAAAPAQRPGRTSVKTKAVAPLADEQDNAKRRTTMKFTFTMESFVIELHNTLSADESVYVRDVPLARFCLQLLSVKGRAHSDGALHVSALLADCTLDDARPSRGDRITRYLERRRGPEDESPDAAAPAKLRSMIDVTYTVKNDDTFVDLRVFSFNLILAMDFLLRISEFATGGLEAAPAPAAEADDPEAGQPLADTDTELEVGRDVDLAAAPALKKSSSSVARAAPAARSVMLTVDMKIEQPDIILVESLETKVCEALIMNMELRLKLRQSNEHMVAEGSISGLQLVVGQLGLARDGPPQYLLAPCSVSAAVSRPPSMAMHLDISMSDIYITFSPEIIALVSRVLTTVTRREGDAVALPDEVVFYDVLWDLKRFKPSTYWFLKSDEAQDALMMEVDETEEKKPITGEICLLSSPTIEISMEMQVGNERMPVLVLQSSFNAQIKDWSSELYVESVWAMQVSYYNASRAVWEPLVEPVECLRDHKYTHEPWELKIEVTMSPASNRESFLASLSMDEEANARAVALQQAATTVNVSCSEPLELTLTKSGLDLLSQLGETFSQAVDVTDASKSTMETAGISSLTRMREAPYLFHNKSGLTAQLILDKDVDFVMFPAAAENDYKELVIEPGASVPLQPKHSPKQMRLNQVPATLRLHVKVPELKYDMVTSVGRAERRYFPVRSGALSGGLVLEVKMCEGSLAITLRSVVTVHNTLSADVSVYYMAASGAEVVLVGAVRPGGALELPFHAVYTPTAEIFFCVDGFSVSASPFVWKELEQEVHLSKMLYCQSKDKSNDEKFYIMAVGKMEQVYLENTSRKSLASASYDVTLRPVVRMQNCLPVAVAVSQLGRRRTQHFQPGEMFHLSHLVPVDASLVVMIPNYLDKCWTCTKEMPGPTDHVVWSFQSHDSPSLMILELGMQSTYVDGTQVLSLYCPFWMLNKTGFTLCYRKSKKGDSGTPKKQSNDESDGPVFHPPEYREPIMFSYKAKHFFGKKNASIRIGFGEWSDKFPLDVPGSSGVVVCKDEDKAYQVAVTNQLTYNSLTKMVIFTPYYLIKNEAPFNVLYQEVHRPGDPWVEIPKKSSAPLWPAVVQPDKLLRLKVECTEEVTPPFLYTEESCVCLKLDNVYGGLQVEVQMTEGGTYITIRQYRHGHAPALLVNYSPYTLTVYEKENVNSSQSGVAIDQFKMCSDGPGQVASDQQIQSVIHRKIPKLNQLLYSWDNPAGPRILVFEEHKGEVEVDLKRDGLGFFMVSEHQRVSWVSFLDGTQRVVLFSNDVSLARSVHFIGDAQPIDKEFVLSMYGMGLSLVNDLEHLELMYISVSNSGIIWEQCKLGARRYKRLDAARAALLEEAWQRRQQLKRVAGADDAPPPQVVTLDDKTVVDLEELRVLKPSPRLLRRSQQPGLWATYAVNEHCVRIHARLHRLQIDQQLPSPTFPVVLAPVPPPRSVTQGQGKPFIEISITERTMRHTAVRQYKYYKVLVQEFHVKIDMGFIAALMDMFPEKQPTEQEALERLREDLERARQPLDELVAQEAASELKNFFDNLHLSPLKVHVSFSLGGSKQLPTFIGTVMQSIGATLTDMNDVVFKLSYYERNYEFLSQREMISQVRSHYTGQALKQLYVLVLGLDVIGNPYGLVIGLKKGVEDLFYEPFQGAIQGPGEFAEGLFLGVRSLVGHTVGGAAGAVSRITGAMGHGLAALSLDKDYQRRRRENMNKQPANLQEGLARSGKGLVMGLVDGVTGVFTKPIEGAQEEGVEGFFKGLGRGAVGLVTRPTAGFVDFASGSLSAVKRVTDMSEETTKSRPPRYLPQEGAVRPYSRLQAEGCKLLFELEKGKYMSTDKYEAHVWVIPEKEIVMCTDKRLFYLEKNNVFGMWQVVWSFLWTEIPEAPSEVKKGIYIPTAKRKVLGMFPGAATGKVIFIYNESHKKYFLAQCERLMADAR